MSEDPRTVIAEALMAETIRQNAVLDVEPEDYADAILVALAEAGYEIVKKATA